MKKNAASRAARPQRKAVDQSTIAKDASKKRVKRPHNPIQTSHEVELGKWNNLDAAILKVIFEAVVPPSSFMDASLFCGPNSPWCEALRMKKTFTLVCRQWRPAGLKLLYEEVVLRRVGQAIAFAKLLESPNASAIMLLVRKLSIPCFIPDTLRPIVTPTVTRVLQLCHQVTSLELGSSFTDHFLSGIKSSFSLEDEAFLSALGQIGSRIRKLELTPLDAELPIPPHFVNMFPNLRSLALPLINSSSQSPGWDAPVYLDHLSELKLWFPRRDSVSESNILAVTNWDLPQLKRVVVHFGFKPGDEACQSLTPLIAQHGSKIKELDFAQSPPLPCICPRAPVSTSDETAVDAVDEEDSDDDEYVGDGEADSHSVTIKAALMRGDDGDDDEDDEDDESYKTDAESDNDSSEASDADSDNSDIVEYDSSNKIYGVRKVVHKKCPLHIVAHIATLCPTLEYFSCNLSDDAAVPDTLLSREPPLRMDILGKPGHIPHHPETRTLYPNVRVIDSTLSGLPDLPRFLSHSPGRAPSDKPIIHNAHNLHVVQTSYALFSLGSDAWGRDALRKALGDVNFEEWDFGPELDSAGAAADAMDL
ncbi:hypothetical protein BXZ70DRAFT_618583 [Cristinia sonorae]|uniref:F-box domain-containing protein n=1 Tax=Cristinia sonorae TaxID=1940300 RepID=A0A8K0XT00_9AGAR|nr:hypothetical protein BXZ70DRAFT_618583 [Cristinia sonorae]